MNALTAKRTFRLLLAVSGIFVGTISAKDSESAVHSPVHESVSPSQEELSYTLYGEYASPYTLSVMAALEMTNTPYKFIPNPPKRVLKKLGDPIPSILQTLPPQNLIDQYADAESDADEAGMSVAEFVNQSAPANDKQRAIAMTNMAFDAIKETQKLWGTIPVLSIDCSRVENRTMPSRITFPNSLLAVALGIPPLNYDAESNTSDFYKTAEAIELSQYANNVLGPVTVVILRKRVTFPYIATKIGNKKSAFAAKALRWMATDTRGAQKLLKNKLPPLLQHFEKSLAKEGGRIWLAGTQNLSMADITTAMHLMSVELSGADLDLKKYPKLAAWFTRIRAVPAIHRVLEKAQEEITKHRHVIGDLDA